MVKKNIEKKGDKQKKILKANKKKTEKNLKKIYRKRETRKEK